MELKVELRIGLITHPMYLNTRVLKKCSGKISLKLANFQRMEMAFLKGRVTLSELKFVFYQGSSVF